MKPLIIILFIALLIGCRSTVRDEIIKSSPTSISPDGNALIYQSHYVDNGIYFISLGTWINANGIEGGGGIFNMESNKLDTLQVKWISDTLAIISYPMNSKITRQLPADYFAGRNINLQYKTIANK